MRRPALSRAPPTMCVVDDTCGLEGAGRQRCWDTAGDPHEGPSGHSTPPPPCHGGQAGQGTRLLQGPTMEE